MNVGSADGRYSDTKRSGPICSGPPQVLHSVLGPISLGRHCGFFSAWQWRHLRPSLGGTTLAAEAGFFAFFLGAGIGCIKNPLEKIRGDVATKVTPPLTSLIVGEVGVGVRRGFLVQSARQEHVTNRLVYKYMDTLSFGSLTRASLRDLFDGPPPSLLSRSMGKRRERRLAAMMAASRRVKLDLFTEPSGILRLFYLNSLQLHIMSSGQKQENPLLLLEQYSDDELEDDTSEQPTHTAEASVSTGPEVQVLLP
ncbi:hypothetical protein GW17_00043866 [Ensete ventricosum]|nr:hypothetical protein GW17_00043866 [Ensete ventricosum]